MRDAELLTEYLRSGSESAFAELVNRYVGLACAVAQRQLGDQHLAEEVGQMVFCLLLRKATSLTRYDSLAGWVHRAAYHLSLKTFRDERKRRDRERALADMHDPLPPHTPQQSWEHLVPLLDEALDQLSDSDRGVLVLRFMQQKGMREVGEALGTTEAAAKMRVGRAIEKLRNYFARRGVSCSSAGLAAALASLAGEAVRAGLSASVAVAALSTAGAGAGAGWSLLTTFMLMTKLKTTLVLVGFGAVGVFITGSYLVERSLESRPASAQSDMPGPAGGIAGPARREKPNALFTLSESMMARFREAGLARARAKLEAALAAPRRLGTSTYPSAAITEAIESFGVYQQQAFPLLKEALTGGNPEARRQAVAALGLIGKNVPEARPLLWQLLRGGEDQSSFGALTALANIGVLPEEIERLAALIPGQTNQLLVRYLPETIARAIRRDPAAMAPHLAPLEALLEHADPVVRFSAACALAEVQGAQKPEILKGVAAGLAVSDKYHYQLHHQATGEFLWNLMAVETLQRLGPAAKDVLPVLKAYAESAPDASSRERALRAIAAIDGEAGLAQPEVRSVVARDEQRNSLRERLQTGTFTTEDLSQGLQEPFTAALAAERLAEIGPAAKNSLPELSQALAGKDEATREKIMAAIQEIDSSYQVERIPSNPVTQGALAAQHELLTQRANGSLNEATATSLEKLIDGFRMVNTSWYTRREVADFSERLQAENPRIWNVFVTKATETDPALQSLLAGTNR